MLAQPLQNISRSADFALAKCRAEETFHQFCSGSIPVDPMKVAIELGLNVQFTHFRQDIAHKILGLLEIQSRTIHVNAEIPTNRATFTIAHEIGHYLLHREWAESQSYKALWRSPEWEKGSKPPEEQEADCFASNLLVPRFMLRRYIQLETDNHMLAQAFCVSEDVVVYAKRDLDRYS